MQKYDFMTFIRRWNTGIASAKNGKRKELRSGRVVRKWGGRAGYQIYRSFELPNEEFGEGKMSPSSVSADLQFYCQMGPLSSDWIIITSNIDLDPGMSFQKKPESRQSFLSFKIHRTYDLELNLNVCLWHFETHFHEYLLLFVTPLCLISVFLFLVSF